MLIRLKVVRARRGSPDRCGIIFQVLEFFFFLHLVSFRLKVETKLTEGQINLHVETVKPPVFLFSKKKKKVSSPTPGPRPLLLDPL